MTEIFVLSMQNDKVASRGDGDNYGKSMFYVCFALIPTKSFN